MGATSMMAWTSLMMTSVRPSAAAMIGAAFSRGMRVSAAPTASAMNTTWSMLPSASAVKGFLGTMSSSVAQASGATADSTFAATAPAASLASVSRSAGESHVPGRAMLARTSPMLIATAVVDR